MRLLNSITNSMDMNLSKLWERVKDRGIWMLLSISPTPNPIPMLRFIVDTSTYRVAKHENSVSSSFKSGLARVSLSGVTRAHPQNETQFSSQAKSLSENGDM